jgi:hypothetical protein
MKKFLLTIIIVSLFTLSLKIFFDEYQSGDFLGGSQNGKTMISKIPLFKKTVCDRTLKYSIGNFDERFGITREEFLNAIKSSEKVWEDSVGLDLFEFDPEATFKIDLIFDERQKQSMESEELTHDYEELIEVQGEISDEYRSLENKYNALITSYNKDVKDYEKEVGEYNSDVEKWNKKGGAPPKEYKKLEKKSEELRDWYEDLQDDIDDINSLAREINKLAKKEVELISEYNESVETYRDRYGEAKEFNQGEYDGEGIVVYQFMETSDLILVLAHEFGHALNIGHIENPASIMYYLMEQQDLENIRPTEEDVSALKIECEME